MDRLLRSLARLLVRGPDAPFVLGDLEESLRRDLAAGRSAWHARGRYALNAGASAVTMGAARARSLTGRDHGALRDHGAPPRGARAFLPGVSLLDLKLALRMLLKQPGLTAVAVFALTLGIPAALYPFHFLSVFDAPMPFEEGERIVGLRHADGMEKKDPTIHAYVGWRDAVGSLEAIGAARPTRLNLVTDDGRVSPRRGAYMSASSFDLLRVPPLLGRPLLESDEVPGAPDVVVLGFETWQSLFDGDPGVVGRALRVGGAPHTVVGVMPRGFLFPVHEHLWLPLRDDPAAWPVGEGPELEVYGRLADGVTPRRAAAEMTATTRRLAEVNPDAYRRLRAEVVPYPYLMAGLAPAEARWLLLPFQALALVLLAVACGNVGTLVLARIAMRSGEVAVRTALGATRVRIVTQIFVECLVLALVATGLGLLLAQLAAEQFGKMEAWAVRPFWLDFGLRPSTVLMGLGLAVFSAVFAGVVPALKATGSRIQGNLQRGAAGGGVRFGRATTALIVAEVALGVACLFAATLSWRYLPPPAGAGVGVPLDRFLSAAVLVDPSARFSRPVEGEDLRTRAAAVQEELVRRVEREPGVHGAAVADVLPGQNHPAPLVEVEGIPPSDRTSQQRAMRARVGVGFFEALGRPVLDGRGFSESDLPDERGEVSDVVVVNTAFVERLVRGRDPIGKRVRWVSWDGEPGPWLRVVGVVGSLGMTSVDLPDDAGVYHPLAPGELHPARLVVHLADRPAAFAPRLRTIAAEIDPATLIENPTPLNELVSMDRALMQWGILGIAVVAGIALVLSVAGLYALMSFTVSQRTREIGVRTALGADVGAIMAVVVRRALFQLSLGVAIAVVGIGAALPVVAPGDKGVWLWELIGAGAVVLVIGLAACVVPTLRGLRIRPVEALRS